MLYFISHHFKISLKESLFRSETFEEEKYGVKFASECEVCKIFTQEFEAKLKESSKKHEVSFYSIIGHFCIPESFIINI